MERSYDNVIFSQVENHVATVTINNPPVNVLNARVLAALSACFDALAEENNLRCIILTGTKRSFLAGGDISEFKGLSEADFLSLIQKVHTVLNKIEQFPAPTIVAINGYALGGGLELTLTCDIRLAADTASMSLPEATVGMMPSFGGTARLAKLITPAQAKYLIYKGERFGAEEALRLGIVQEVCTYEQLLPRAKELAAQIASKAPIPLRLVKSVIHRAQGGTMEEALALELEGALKTASTRDIQEGVSAFLEKRTPKFHNL